MATKGDEPNLLRILEKSVIPQVAQAGMALVFTALPAWKSEMDLPEGMTARRTRAPGQRVPLRARRHYGGSPVLDAEWPEDQMHSARAPKLCFILAGTVEFRIADYMVQCRPGHVLPLPPGIPFADGKLSVGNNKQPHQQVCELLQMISYHGGLLCWRSRDRYDKLGRKQGIEEAFSIPYSQVSFYLHQLTSEAAARNQHRGLVCGSLLNLMLALLHRELQQLPVIKTGHINSVIAAPAAGQAEYSMAQAQEYIHHNLREPLSIDRVARFACMSRTAFTARFRAQTGKSFSDYVADRRFQEARRILTETDLATGQVAALVGLKPNRMRVLFQQRENASPTEFRRLNRKAGTINSG